MFIQTEIDNIDLNLRTLTLLMESNRRTHNYTVEQTNKKNKLIIGVLNELLKLYGIKDDKPDNNNQK